MHSSDLQLLIANHLEDMADQVQFLYDEGNYAEAELLREEGLSLAEAYDNEQTFMFLPNFTTT
jgi:hypothetical protein